MHCASYAHDTTKARRSGSHLATAPSSSMSAARTASTLSTISLSMRCFSSSVAACSRATPSASASALAESRAAWIAACQVRVR